MLKHENPNIEVINGNLWAVRFALIPMIPQISYKPDPEVSLADLPGQLTPDGLMILNKDFKFYDKLLKITQTVMKMKDRVIRKEIIEMGKAPAPTTGRMASSSRVFTPSWRKAPEPGPPNGAS